MTVKRNRTALLYLKKEAVALTGGTVEEVSVDSTCNTAWTGTYSTVQANSGTWGAGGGSNLEILDEGGSLTSTASAINFVGAGVTTGRFSSLVCASQPARRICFPPHKFVQAVSEASPSSWR